MSRRTVFNAILACLLIGYIFVMVPLTNRAERNDTFKDVTIRLNESQHAEFLTVADVNHLLSDIESRIDTLRRCHLNTLRLEEQLNGNNRIEWSACNILNDGTLSIVIEPIDPVARIFDRKGSVYVNAEGKKVPAHPSYHVDVPVVTTAGEADSNLVKKLLPVLRTIKTSPGANSLVSSLRIDGKGDIIIIPNIVGHVINFGDTTLIDNKLERLHVFYRDVMPVRGWDAYDTISVKWKGRVVATRRDKTVPARIPLDKLDDIVNEILDDDVMMTDNQNI